MSRPKAPKASVPSGTDETRLVTSVREQWHKYQGQEKRFSKDFALALIALHKKLAKPHCGLFQDKLKELKIPRSTAYRVMGLHGCKADKRPIRAKEYTIEGHRAARYDMLRNEVRAYCTSVRKDPEYKAKLETFFDSLTQLPSTGNCQYRGSAANASGDRYERF